MTLTVEEKADQNTNIPSGYKFIEPGIFPNGWQIKPFGQIAEITMGQSPMGASYNRNSVGIPLINGPTEFTKKYPIKIQWTSQPTKLCKAGDILLCVRGSSTGRMNISDDLYCIGRGIASIRAKRDTDPTFLSFQLNSAIQKILALAAGSTFPNIDGKTIRSIGFLLPSINEQQAIATALSDIDALITSLEQLIAKKRNIKLAAMQQLLIGMQRLPGFSEDWKRKTLEEIADIDPENLGKDTNPGYCFKYISLEDVDKGVLRGYTEQIFYLAPSRARRKIRKSDILISTVRPNLKSHLLIRNDVCNIICSTGFSVLRCKSAYADPTYVYAHFFASGIDRQIESLLTGSNYPAISSKDLRSLTIPIPSLAEQKCIGSVLSDMDTELSTLEQQLNKAQNLKQGMMQELLTGRIRLK